MVTSTRISTALLGALAMMFITPPLLGLAQATDVLLAGRKPLLIGVSEGAGLSVLAASDASLHEAIAGVIALSLGDANELEWRWKDALIHVTHGVPEEPTFSVVAKAGGVAPTRLWVIDAADHRFSDQQPELARRLVEAIAWVLQSGTR